MKSSRCGKFLTSYLTVESCTMFLGRSQKAEIKFAYCNQRKSINNDANELHLCSQQSLLGIHCTIAGVFENIKKKGKAERA